MTFLRTTLFGGALAGLLATSLFAPEAVAAPKSPPAEVPTKQVAQVKVELKTEAGRVIKADAQLEWGAPGNVELASEGHTHTVGLEVARAAEDKPEVTVTLRYHLDDKLVVAPFTFDAKVKKREVLHIEGGPAIALTVTPKTVKAPPPPEEDEKPKDKIDVGDDPQSPLGGLK